MAKSRGSQINDDSRYEDLREQGESKGKAARLAAAKAAGALSRRSVRVEDRIRGALYEEPQEIGIIGPCIVRSLRSPDASVSHVRRLGRMNVRPT